MATILAEAGRGRALRQIRVIPNFNGVWVGWYRVAECASLGTFDACANVTIGQRYLASFTLTQVGQTVTSAAYHSNDIHFAKVGTGVVSLDGTLTIVEDTTKSLRAITWNLRPMFDDSRRIGGDMLMHILDSTPEGYSLRVRFEFDTPLEPNP